jgi:16S rRNA (guanine(966)-N(2))-methyltransferase RsmD
MRIITGMAKGMVLVAPRGADVRPTSDRVREAIFSSLGERVVNADVLDLYAGTGALGLEAASRGARSVVFIEKARPSLAAIEKNLANFAKNRGVACAFAVVRGDVLRELSRLDRQFSLIFADPPYAINPVPVLREVYDRQVLAPGGVLVLETSKRAVLAAGWPGELEREAVYGETRVCHFRAARVGD